MHQPAHWRHTRLVLAFSLCYLGVSGAMILTSGNLEFLLYLAVMAVIIIAVLAVNRRAGLSRTLLWCFSGWGLLHMAGGLVPLPAGWHAADTSGVLYNWRIFPGYLKYDQLVHGFGVGLVTWLTWQALSVRVRSLDGTPLRPTTGILGVCATTGMGFGALNEVIEFFAVLILPKTNVGDYENTGWDLVANAVGAIIAAGVIAGITTKRRRTQSPG